MDKTIKLLFLIIVLLVAGCSMPKGPVPHSGEAPEAEGWEIEVVLSGLEHPWSMAWLPGDEMDMLITERPGRLRVYKMAKCSQNPFQDCRKYL